MKKIGYLFLSLLLMISLTSCGKNKVENNENNKGENTDKIAEKLSLNIIDTSSNSRPIAVMINNHPDARPYHSGLQDAYVIYEIMVEGGLTRYMAVFKDKDTERIGSVRSSRHYYLDYVLENDAIYTHFGWSVIAERDIPKLGINNVNGLYDNGFWRESLPVAYEHTAFTSMANIKANIETKGYRTTTDNGTLLNYSVSEIDLSKNSDAIRAESVVVPYSYSITSSYSYDSVNKVYNRYVNDVPHKDYITGNNYTFKNILVLKVNNYSLDGYLQELENIGTGDGYYITDGYAIPIKWNKESRESKTTYKTLSGEDVKINDGNTFIQIMPISNNPSIN